MKVVCMENNRVNFVKSEKEKKIENLELVHIDVWGLAEVSSLSESQNYGIFINGANRKVWVYFLRHKSNVFQTFKTQI